MAEVYREPAAAYMDRRALIYMREYIACEGDFGSSAFVNLDTAYVADKLKYAGILSDFTGPEISINEELGTRTERWVEHTSTLSPLGEYLRQRYSELYSQNNVFQYNFWTIRGLLDIWPLRWLEEASAHQHKQREMPSRHVVTNFMSIFQLEFPLDENARQYLRDRIRAGAEEPIRQIPLPAQFVDVPVQVDRSDAALKLRQDIEAEFSFDGDLEPEAIDGDGFPISLRAQPQEDSAADFDFGEADELPDEEAGNQDIGGTDADFPDEEDDAPALTAEEEEDGWRV